MSLRLAMLVASARGLVRVATRGLVPVATRGLVPVGGRAARTVARASLPADEKGWMTVLSPNQFAVLRNKATEPPNYSESTAGELEADLKKDYGTKYPADGARATASTQTLRSRTSLFRRSDVGVDSDRSRRRGAAASAWDPPRRRGVVADRLGRRGGVTRLGRDASAAAPRIGRDAAAATRTARDAAAATRTAPRRGSDRYACVGCGTPLYYARTKFNSGCGWPAFFDGIPGAIKEIPDADGYRVEIVCSNCEGHLGHVFKGEGFPSPTDARHCVNGIALRYESDAPQPDDVTAMEAHYTPRSIPP